ncbi:hypothetical protein CVV67_35755 [Arthrobacter stackebrandtii]|nr:hypothetical protein CVV67_35755 [Arthrobacter stackebrandtii]
MEPIPAHAMYASRWLLAPIYFGLSLGLLALALKFFQEVVHVLPNVFALSEADLILVILSLIDMSLVGGLLVSQALTLFTTPVIYLALERLFHRRQAARAAAPSAS